MPGTRTFTITGTPVIGGTFEKVVTYAEFIGGSYSIEVPVGIYTVTEDTSSAAVAGYTLVVSGNGTEQALAKDETVTFTITNTYTNNSTPPVTPPVLDKENHYGYIVGYPDGTVQPNGNITRTEVATIFFRLLTEESREALWCTTNPFSDVNSTDWFNNAISTMYNAGIVSGYPDGTFRPNAKITRAELATIVARFLEDRISAGVEINLSDISGHWAEGFIIEVAENGIITGYPDGTFKPDQAITRAETVTMINRLLQRKPDKDHMLDNMIVWPDNQDTEAWFYEAIQEATNSHTYYFNNALEVWTELQEIRDWAALEKAWSEWNSSPNPGDVMP